MRQTHVIAFASILVAAAASTAPAVKPAVWTHEQPKDFTSAKLENLVVTSKGEVLLARKTETLHVPGEEAEAVNALARAGDGRLYAATGPKGVIYRIDGPKVDAFARLPDNASVFSLLFDQDGMLLAGTGGPRQARIYRIDGRGKPAVFYEPPGARYVWAMVRGPRGEIYAATGTEGKLFAVEPDGRSGKVLAKVKPRNLLCLAFGPDDMLYGGTDEDGLIYRFNPASGKTYVLYDAKEPEISSIVLDAEGNIYAATAAADSARPGRSVADAPGGRPEQAETKPVTQPAPPKGAPATRPGAATRPAAADDGDDDEEEPETQPVRVVVLPQQIGRPVQPGKPSPAGNAVYRIDTQGFVTEIFREPVMILALAEEGGTLYAATGNEGRIYAIHPATEKTVVLAKLQSQQATALLRLPRGRVLVGTANQAMLVELSDDFAPEGTLTAEPLDAEQVVKWGRLHWDAAVPEGTRLTVATRSGNVQDPESEAYDAWSPEMDATVPQQIASPGARFLQYRLTLKTTVPAATPTLRKITMARIEENRAPRIAEMKVMPVSEAAKDPASPPRIKGLAAGAMAAMGGEKPSPQPDYHAVAVWKVSDPNQDQLQFQVFLREVGRQPWIRIAKELNEPYHVWDTRTTPDGRYEIRIVADDSPDNPPGTWLSDARVSDPIVVDNTPPDVTIGVVTVAGTKRVTINATMTDALSFIAEAAYSVDSEEKWVSLNALDDIFDSLSEAVSFTIEDLSPGDHRVALRVRDRLGNTRYATQYVSVP